MSRVSRTTTPGKDSPHVSRTTTPGKSPASKKPQTADRHAGGKQAAGSADSPASKGNLGAKRDLAKMALAAAMARPPVEDMLVRFAQRLGARQYDIRGNSALLRPLIMDTLVTWCATAPQHKCVPLMLQSTAALAGMAMADDEDAKLMVDRGILPVLMNMMEHGIGAPPTPLSPQEQARRAKLEAKSKGMKRGGEEEKPPVSKDPRMRGPTISASGIPWRSGCGDAAITALWALIQTRSTVERVVEIGAVRPLCILCLQATEAQTLRQTTAAIRDVAFLDKNRDLVLEHGGLEALALCLDKCEDQLLSHLERELPTLRKHVAQALQNLTLSYKVRKHFIENGLVERIMALCLMQDMDKKLTTPNHVLGYAIAALANVSHLYEARTKLLDLGVAAFLSKMLDLCKNGLVTMHVCIAIRNLALRKASPDFQRWMTTKDERNQLDFGAANALKFLVDVCERQLPPNNDNKVLEHVLNALIALLWNCPKNRLRMANKEVVDLQVLTKLVASGKELNAAIRQRLAILLADLAQLPSVQGKLAELGLLNSIFDWLFLPPEEAVTRYCAGGAVMNMVADDANSTKFGKAVMVSDPSKSFIAACSGILLERPIMDSLLMNVAGLLANLSFRNDNNRAKVMQAGAVQTLIEYVSDQGEAGSTQSDGALRRNIMIGALLQNLTAGVAFRSKIVGYGGVQTLIRIVSSGKHKDMVRYALGALRNLANDAPIQRQLVDEGLLDSCIYISTHYGEGDVFEDGSTPAEHAASIVRNLCGNDQIRHRVRQNNALQTLSKQVDPASKNICEDYVRLKPDLNPSEVMVACLSANGDVSKEHCGSTDNAEPPFPPECEHLRGDIGARVAWGLLLEMVNKLWFEYEAPRPDLAEILAIMEEEKAREEEKKTQAGPKKPREDDLAYDESALPDGEEDMEIPLVESPLGSPTGSLRSPPRRDAGVHEAGGEDDGMDVVDGREPAGGAGGGVIEKEGQDILEIVSPRDPAAIGEEGGGQGPEGGEGAGIEGLLLAAVSGLKSGKGREADAADAIERALILLRSGGPGASVAVLTQAPLPAVPRSEDAEPALGVEEGLGDREKIAALTLEVEELRGKLQQLQTLGGQALPSAEPPPSREEGRAEDGEVVPGEGEHESGLVGEAEDEGGLELGMEDVKRVDDAGGLGAAEHGENGSTAGSGEAAIAAGQEGGDAAAATGPAGRESDALDAPVPSQPAAADIAGDGDASGGRSNSAGQDDLRQVEAEHGFAAPAAAAFG